MTKVPAKVETWDDERGIGNSLIVGLKRGWKWDTDPMVPTHVEGFDTVRAAKAAVRRVLPCACSECSECKQ
jgi:hypothetical protein